MALSISIIVPVYNVENYIKDCFQSIVNQTYTAPMECLFIDDCGNDNSVQILEGLIKAYDGPIEMRLLHHDKNRGLSGARNTGIANAKGDYLFFLDSDDQLYPYSISCLVDAALKENMPEMVLGSYHLNIADHPLNRYHFNYMLFNGQPTIAKAFLDGKLFCMAPNKLVRREFILDNRLFFKEGIIHEDNLWSFQSFHLAQIVVTIPEITYYYLIHNESIMTSTNQEKRLLSCKVIYDEVVSDINNNRYEPVTSLSILYVKEMMNTRCFRLIDDIYIHTTCCDKRRLQMLKSISDNCNQLIADFWLTPTRYLKLLKITFRYRLFIPFDVLMIMGKLKNRICQRFR